MDNTGTTTFGFDASGNQRFQQTPSSGTTTNTWDYENRLTKVALPNGIVNTFTYNGDGQRVQRQDSSGTSKQVWDDQKIVEETDQNNVVQVVYTQSAGEYGDVISQRRSGIANFFLFEPIGSSARLADGTGTVSDTYLFKAFGAELLSGGTVNPFRYIGRLGYYLNLDVYDVHAGLRTLSPVLGRWRTRDPVGLRAGNNLFVYVHNSPTKWVDPSGQVTICKGSHCTRRGPLGPEGVYLYEVEVYGNATFGGCYSCKAGNMAIQHRFTDTKDLGTGKCGQPANREVDMLMQRLPPGTDPFMEVFTPMPGCEKLSFTANKSKRTGCWTLKWVWNCYTSCSEGSFGFCRPHTMTAGIYAPGGFNNNPNIIVPPQGPLQQWSIQLNASVQYAEQCPCCLTCGCSVSAGMQWESFGFGGVGPYPNLPPAKLFIDTPNDCTAADIARAQRAK